MPSLIRQSSAFASNKLALVAQGLSQDKSGLVTVDVAYVSTQTNNDYWSNIFTINSAPPIWPDIISASSLQNSGLYMGSRSLSKANGLVQISAVYYGALQSALSAKYKVETVEWRTVDFVATSATSTSTTRLGFRCKVIEYLAAVCDNKSYRVPTPSVRSMIVALTSSQTIGSVKLLNNPFDLLYAISSVVQEGSNNIYTPSISVVGTRFTIATQQSFSA